MTHPEQDRQENQQNAPQRSLCPVCGRLATRTTETRDGRAVALFCTDDRDHCWFVRWAAVAA